MDKFEIDIREDDGTLWEFLFWTTNGRCYMKARENGVEHKARRISESDYISAWESYKDY